MSPAPRLARVHGALASLSTVVLPVAAGTLLVLALSDAIGLPGGPGAGPALVVLGAALLGLRRLPRAVGGLEAPGHEAAGLALFDRRGRPASPAQRVARFALRGVSLLFPPLSLADAATLLAPGRRSLLDRLTATTVARSAPGGVAPANV